MYHSKDSNKRANMKQKGHAPQHHHHHHHPVLADPNFLLGHASSGADGGGGGVDRSMRSPPTAEVHFAPSPSFPEEENVDERNYNDSLQKHQQPASSPSSRMRRQMTVTTTSPASAFAAGESSHAGTGMSTREQQQQQLQLQQPPPLTRSTTERETGGVVSRGRPRSGFLSSRGVFAHKSPPAPLGGGRTGPLGGYMIQQGGSYRGGGGGASGFLGGGEGLSGGGRGGGGHGGQQVRWVVVPLLVSLFQVYMQIQIYIYIYLSNPLAPAKSRLGYSIIQYE